MKSENIIILALIILIIASAGIYAFINSTGNQTDDNNAILNTNMTNNTGNNTIESNSGVSGDSESSQSTQDQSNNNNYQGENSNDQTSANTTSSEDTTPSTSNDYGGAGYITVYYTTIPKTSLHHIRSYDIHWNYIITFNNNSRNWNTIIYFIR